MAVIAAAFERFGASTSGLAPGKIKMLKLSRVERPLSAQASVVRNRSA